MAPKRHRGDDDTMDVESSAELGSSAEFSKPVYVVARGLAANSVFVVDAAAVAGGNLREPARHLGELPASIRGMSFVAAHSKHGSWIVAVGGRTGRTIIYDPSTLEGFRGPGLCCPKRKPVLISHGSKVYAISRTPSVHLRRTLDFEPWFESLNFNKGIPCVLNEEYSEWKSLPPPPFFPCLLDPLEFRNPPKISISSYAAVDSHILFSPQQEDVGTYAFHVVEKTWEKVWDENLPFVGQAVHLGGNLFAAACRVISNNFVVTASVFRMSIKVSMSPAVSHKLSVILVKQFPVASDGKIPRPLFCPLGKGGFCVIRKVSFRPNKECLKMSLTSFQMDNIQPMLTACQTESADSGDMLVELKVEQFMVPSQYLPSPLTVVAALSM